MKTQSEPLNLGETGTIYKIHMYLIALLMYRLHYATITVVPSIQMVRCLLQPHNHFLNNRHHTFWLVRQRGRLQLSRPLLALLPRPKLPQHLMFLGTVLRNYPFLLY